MVPYLKGDLSDLLQIFAHALGSSLRASIFYNLLDNALREPCVVLFKANQDKNAAFCLAPHGTGTALYFTCCPTAMPTTVSDYYHTLESRIGYKLVLGGTRHFGYYKEGTLWPFPISSALRRMEERLYQTLGLEDNALVLDAGTGNGDVAIFMARKGLRIKAIDLLDMHVRWAKANVERKHLDGQIEVSKGNYEQLDFENDSFDGAYTMETLVHAGEPNQAMREFYRVLKPGGVVTHVEYEHDMDNNPAGRSAMSRINNYAHMPAFEQFPLGTIRNSLEKVGFREVEVQDLTQNVAPMMRFFFFLAYIPYLIIQLLGLEAYFVNAMAAVELWRHSGNIRYLMVKGRKPLHEPSDSDKLRRRLKEKDLS